MRLRIRFKDITYMEQFKDAEVDEVRINPPNSMLVTVGESTTVLLLSTMAKVKVTG